MKSINKDKTVKDLKCGSGSLVSQKTSANICDLLLSVLPHPFDLHSSNNFHSGVHDSLMDTYQRHQVQMG